MICRYRQTTTTYVMNIRVILRTNVPLNYHVILLYCAPLLTHLGKHLVFKLVFQTRNQQSKACVLPTTHKGPKGKNTMQRNLQFSSILKRIFNYFKFKRSVKMLLVKFFVFVMLMDNKGHVIK